MLDRTYRLLDSTNLTYREIATGAEVGFEWLKSLASRRIGEPGTSKIQRLHDFLVASHKQNARAPIRAPMRDA